MIELWEWIKQNREAITIVCSILGGITAFIGILTHLTKLRTLRTPAEPALPKETEPLRPEWPAGSIARTVVVDALRNGFPVAPRTKLMVIDRGVRQFSLEPGQYTANDFKLRLRSHDIGPRAHGLQYVTVPKEIEVVVTDCRSPDSFTDVECHVLVQVKVADATAEKLMEWHLNRHGHVNAEDVDKTMVAAIAPWLKSHIGVVEFDKLSSVFQNLRADAEAILQTELASHGLTAAVRSFEFRSAQQREFTEGLGTKFHAEMERINQRSARSGE